MTEIFPSGKQSKILGLSYKESWDNKHTWPLSVLFFRELAQSGTLTCLVESREGTDVTLILLFEDNTSCHQPKISLLQSQTRSIWLDLKESIHCRIYSWIRFLFGKIRMAIRYIYFFVYDGKKIFLLLLSIAQAFLKAEGSHIALAQSVLKDCVSHSIFASLLE